MKQLLRILDMKQLSDLIRNTLEIWLHDTPWEFTSQNIQWNFCMRFETPLGNLAYGTPDYATETELHLGEYNIMWMP